MPIIKRRVDKSADIKGIGDNIGKRTFKCAEGNLLYEIDRNEFNLVVQVKFDSLHKKKPSHSTVVNDN